jgi:hypothetical protein
MNANVILRGLVRVSLVLLIVCAIFTLALLAGCAAQVPTIKTQIVKVPVPVQVPCPAPSIPARPALPIGNLTPSSTPAQVDQAYVATVAALEGYAAQLEKLLGR